MSVPTTPGRAPDDDLFDDLGDLAGDLGAGAMSAGAPVPLGPPPTSPLAPPAKAPGIRVVVPALPPAVQRRRKAVDVPVVARQRPPHEWDASAPAFEIPEWTPLGCGSMSAAQMSRHTLILGETGSGKSKSGIFPLVRAALSYPGPGGPAGLAPSMLIIDPKREVLQYARRVNAELALGRQIVQFDAAEDGDGTERAAGCTLHVFEGVDLATLTAEECVERVLALSPTFAAERGEPRGAFFVMQAAAVIRQFVQVDMLVHRSGAPGGVAQFWATVAATVQHHVPSLAGARIAYDPANYLAHVYRFVNLAAQSMVEQSAFGFYRDVCAHYGIPTAETLQVTSLATMPSETMSGVIGTMNNYVRDLADPSFARQVSLNPLEAPDAAHRLSVLDALDGGQVVCYYPRDNSTIATMVGKALKAKFFELTFARTRPERPFVYVCDEFQRFITNDATSGEQSFLDRCRAYRASCVLATQSIASLQYALGRDGDSAGDSAALEILFNNTGNKLFFRNTDERTQDRLLKLLPGAAVAGKPHVVLVRPVSTLGVGECYYLLSSGRWGRRGVALPTHEGAAGRRV